MLKINKTHVNSVTINHFIKFITCEEKKLSKHIFENVHSKNKKIYIFVFHIFYLFEECWYILLYFFT